LPKAIGVGDAQKLAGCRLLPAQQLRHNQPAQHARTDTDQKNEQGGPAMPTKSDAFAEKFRELLKEIPDRFTLQQWQDAYREAIFLMGMQILERFEREAIAQIGRPTEGLRAGGGGRSQTSKGLSTAADPCCTTFQIYASHIGGPGGGVPGVARSVGNFFPDYPLSLHGLTKS
jgi:hypothetical protein